MAFPATSQTLDDFGRPDGALGANWVSAFGASGLTIAGHQAAGVGASAWATRLASGNAVYARVAALPATGVIRVSMNTDISASPQLQWSAALNADKTLTITTNGTGTVGPFSDFAAGDWIAISTLADGIFAAAWTFRASVGAWHQETTSALGGGTTLHPPYAPSGFWAALELTDATVLAGAFGAQVFPGADITAPIEHGHGAC